MANEELGSEIPGRIEQHLKSFEVFERIRWQALAFLSVLALAGLSVVTRADSPHDASLGAMSLVILVCLSGIAIQIRVAAIASSLWNRMGILQATSSTSEQTRPGVAEIRRAMPVPRLEVSNPIRFGVPVHICTSFVFATMAAIALSLLVRLLGMSPRCSTLIGFVFLVSLTITFCLWSIWIRKNLDRFDAY